MNDLPNPVTTVENQLAAIAGDENATLPEPVTRVEMYLDYIAKNGMGGNGAGAHNTMVRGKDLMEVFGETGDTVADVVAKISNQISTGDFSNIFVGDYITATVQVGTNAAEELDFVVAGIDTQLGCGDTETTAHHLCMVPDTAFKELAVMNTTDADTGTYGYYGSEMHGRITVTQTVGSGLTSLVADYDTFHESNLGATSTGDDGVLFVRNSSGKWEYNGTDVGANLNNYGITYSGTPASGDTLKVVFTIGNLEAYRKAIYDVVGKAHVLRHREYMTTATSANAWHWARVELMNESMVYGQVVRATNSNGEWLNSSQLPLFAAQPNRKIAHKGKGGSRNAAWLSSISSGTSFCNVSNSGYASNGAAHYSGAVRPYFLLS
jgi:hypothetical protein